MNHTPNAAREPDIFFLPFALPESVALDGVDSDVLSRRLPDFLHHLLNRGGPLPTGMLEVQSPPGDGPVKWVTLSDVPSPEDVIGTLGPTAVRAIVTGTLRQDDAGLAVELTVHTTVEGGPAAREPLTLHGHLPAGDPVPPLCALARDLARVLGIAFPGPPRGVLTANPTAFYKFLEGLDGAAVLSGDPLLETDKDGEQLMAPFADALALDPCFGLALRAAAMAFFVALEGERVGTAAACRVIDRCFASLPTDGEGCVAVAEQLAMLGDDDRAKSWLEHAVRLEPPAPRALESLGVLFANRGNTIHARNLWLRGLSIDGHPDFFAHLARLAFSEGEQHEAWDKVLRGLRRIYERAVRAGEWNDAEQSSGIMLRYLAEHLADETPPEELSEALVDLGGLLTDPDARVDLGLCLLALGQRELARREIDAGLGGDVQPTTRDRGVRALLQIDVEDFEQRFARASDRAAHGRDPRSALVEMQDFLERQPGFWPALFFAGVALRRLDREDDALDLMVEVLDRRPSQPDALREMAELFDRRGNPKRALECVDEAIVVRPEEAELHACRGRYLMRLGRNVEASASIDRAIELEPQNRDYRRQRRRV